MAKTVEEIARETGLSVTTVRFVINGQSEKYRISARTRQLIEDYVAEHGYSLNHAARSLRLNRSETVGFIVPDVANAFFSRLVAELELLCRRHNLLLLTVSAHEDPEIERRAVRNLLGRGVDGLVICPCQSASLSALRDHRSRATIVMFDRDFGCTQYPMVVSDNYGGSLELTRAMLREQGPCHFLCGLTGLPSIQDRIRGFHDACAAAGFDDAERWIRRQADGSPEAARAMMARLIDEAGGAPPSFMCSSLLVLEGALQALRERFGRIDRTLLIGTFDDHAMLDLLPNRVLSIRQNEAALAEYALKRLLEPKSGRKPTLDVVPAALVRRNLDAA